MLATPSLLMCKEQCFLYTRSEAPGLQSSPDKSNRPALFNSGCFVWVIILPSGRSSTRGV